MSKSSNTRGMGGSEPVASSFAAGRYVVTRLIGEGATKRVYLAHDVRLDREVAISIIKTDVLEAGGLARVRAEAQAMAKLGDHPRIVPVYDFGEEHGAPYLVAQYMSGGTLEERLREIPDHRLSRENALRIADQICQALDKAHERGIVHRDVKPANVWLTDEGFAKLGDFGLAISASLSGLKSKGSLSGTVAYMAPEQALGKPVDARSDLYSLGVVLYEMLVGRTPFPGRDLVSIVSQHVQAPPAPPSAHDATIPPALDTLVLGLLAKAPKDRPVNAAAVLPSARSDRWQFAR